MNAIDRITILVAAAAVVFTMAGSAWYSGKPIDDVNARINDVNTRVGGLRTDMNARFTEVHDDITELRTLVIEVLKRDPAAN